MKYIDNEIAIIGIDVNFPEATTKEELWNNLLNGRDCVNEISEGRLKDLNDYLDYIDIPEENRNLRNAAFLKEIDKFDNQFFRIPPNEAVLMDPNHRLFLQSAYGALEDSGYSSIDLNGENVGVYVGFPSEYSNKMYHDIIDDTCHNLIPQSFAGNLPAILPSRISYYLNLKGPTMVIDTACSSSLVAVHVACRAIQQGDCSMALVGGVNLFAVPIMNEVVQGIGIIASDGRAKTFDDECDGVGQGEAVATIVLKPLKKAIESNDNIYAVIKGSAINQDGKSIGITAPNVTAQTAVICEAWDNASIDPKTISYIEAHGTATKIGDPTEISAIKVAFEKYTGLKQFCGIGSIKSNIGHTIGTAGMAGLIKSVLALKHKIIPPTINFNFVNKRIDFVDSPVYVNAFATKWESIDNVFRCGVSSFGISGTNCHIVLESYENNIIKEDRQHQRVFTISAKDLSTLKQLVSNYINYLKVTEYDYDDICYTANVGRNHFDFRIAIIADNSNELLHSLLDVQNSLFELKQPKRNVYFTNNIFTFEKTEKLDMKTCSREERLCFDYVNFKAIDWKEFYQSNQYRRVSLPSYPFRKDRHWVSIPKRSFILNSIYTQMLTPTWKKYEKYIEQDMSCCKKKILIFSHGNKPIEDMIKQKHHDVVLVKIGDRFCQTDGSNFIARANENDFLHIFKTVSDIDKILYISTTTDSQTFYDSDSLTIHLAFFKFLLDVKSDKTIDVTVVTNNACSVLPEEPINPYQSAVLGMFKCMIWETPSINYHCVDINYNSSKSLIAKQILFPDESFLIAIRNNNRYLEEINFINKNKYKVCDTSIKENGVYLICGGLGRLGMIISDWISKQANTTIISIGRSSFPPRETWDNISKETSLDSIKKIEMIRTIEGRGSYFYYYSVDIGQDNQLHNFIDQIYDQYGKIDGIFQCAVDDFQMSISSLNEQLFQESINSKVLATENLYSVLKGKEFDFFLLFSSVMTLIGGKSNITYVAANSYLDNFVINKENVFVINWPEWEGVGLDSNKMIDESISIFKKINKENAMIILDTVLKMKLKRTIVGKANLGSPIFKLKKKLPLSFAININDTLKENNEEEDNLDNIKITLLGRDSKKYSQKEIDIAKVWGAVFGYSELNINNNYFDIGGDSITAFKMQVLFEKMGLPITAADILRHQTIETLAAAI
jgi:beta-ketoacyl synthase